MTKSRSCSPKLELDDDMKTEDLEVNTLCFKYCEISIFLSFMSQSEKLTSHVCF